MRKAQLGKPFTAELPPARNVAASAQAPDAVARAAGVAEEAVLVSVALGPEHTAWRRDRVSPTKRARLLLEKIRPFIIRVLSFWDHRITRISLEGRELFIDPAGSYQVI